MAWIAAVLALLLVPSGALASSSGEIARAEASLDWATASIAGEATRSNGCIRPPNEGPDKEKEEPNDKGPAPTPPTSAPYECGWIPLATIGPGSSPEDCSAPARRLGSIGAGVQLAWVGSELKGAGSAAFDLPSYVLQHGAAGPLLCLSAVETVFEATACIPEIDCSGYGMLHRTYQLDSALLEVIAPPALQTQMAPASPGPSCGKPGKRHRRSIRRAGIGIGAATAVSVKAKRVGRCKTG